MEGRDILEARGADRMWSDALRLGRRVQSLGELIESIPVLDWRLHVEAPLRRLKRLMDPPRPVVGLKHDQADPNL